MCNGCRPGPGRAEHFKMNLYEQLVALGDKFKMYLPGINDTPMEDVDVDEIADEVTTFAQSWLASCGAPVTPTHIDIDIDVDTDVDTDVDMPQSDSEVEAPNQRRKKPKRMTNKRKKAEKSALLSLRRAMSATNGRTHVGKTLQRAIFLATCEAPPLAGPRVKNRFGGLKARIAAVLGVRDRLVDEGETLNRLFHSGTLVIGRGLREKAFERSRYPGGGSQRGSSILHGWGKHQGVT